MRDVLGTIASDQDAIIRSGSHGALVVDGGPGTGKTVVALHRAAYLIYADPRLGHRRGGVLFIGPHQPYLSYVQDVLPSLGEEGVQTCTLRDLVPEGAAAGPETDPQVARLKASLDLVAAIERGVAFYEERPTEGMEVTTDWGDLWLGAHDWRAAFEAPSPGTPHNEARDDIWDELVAILTEKDESDASPDQLRASLQRNDELLTTLNRAWPLLEPTDLVGDLSTVPPSCGSAPPTSTATRSRPSSGPTRPAEPSPTWPCSTPPAAGWVTRTPRDGGDSANRPSPPSAPTWPTSSTTSSRPTTPRCTSCRCCASTTSPGRSSTSRAHPARIPTCSPVRSPTSSSTRRRS